MTYEAPPGNRHMSCQSNRRSATLSPITVGRDDARLQDKAVK